MKVILVTILGQMGKSIMSLEPRVFFTINSPCVSVTVFMEENSKFTALNKNWVQSLRECSHIISFSLLKVGCDWGQSVPLMV